MVQLAGAARAPTKRASEKARSIAWLSVYGFLTDAEKVRAMAGKFKSDPDDELTFDVKPGESSPVTKATQLIMNEPMLLREFDVVGSRSKKSVEDRVTRLCRYWFGARACDPDRTDFKDRPRATKTAVSISEADLEWLGHTLITTVFDDGEGNLRRLGSLDGIRRDLEIIKNDEEQTDYVRVQAAATFDRLSHIQTEVLGGHNLDDLIPRVCEKCGCAL